jgi:aspartyl-tRNA synthetase
LSKFACHIPEFTTADIESFTSQEGFIQVKNQMLIQLFRNMTKKLQIRQAQVAKPLAI